MSTVSCTGVYIAWRFLAPNLCPSQGMKRAVKDWLSRLLHSKGRRGGCSLSLPLLQQLLSNVSGTRCMDQIRPDQPQRTHSATSENSSELAYISY